ncbi:hypothetical protein TKK_0010223 [Trichogramma kaykai]
MHQKNAVNVIQDFALQPFGDLSAANDNIGKKIPTISPIDQEKIIKNFNLEANIQQESELFCEIHSSNLPTNQVHEDIIDFQTLAEIQHEQETENYFGKSTDISLTTDNVVMKKDESTQYDTELLAELLDFNEEIIDHNNVLLRPKDFDGLLKDPALFGLIQTPVNTCPGESLFEMVNRMFVSNIFFDSMYYFEKMFNSKRGNEYHGICPTCGIYIGKIDNFNSNVMCECGEKIDLSKPSGENVFVIIDPSENIQTLLTNNECYYDLIMNERKYDGSIKDIYDERKEIRFESSQYSIWPVYLQINEFPRGRNMITFSMWFGLSKPPMVAYLEPITDYINNLSNGIPCIFKNEKVEIPLFVTSIVVDSVARAPMQGLKQFNGNFGCSWCLNPGERFFNCVRYLHQSEPFELRTTENVINHIENAMNGRSRKECCGVKYVSPLINLKGFDFINGFCPDYMHCCLLGVAKQITEYFLGTMSKDKISALNSMLQKIKVPHKLSRLTCY